MRHTCAFSWTSVCAPMHVSLPMNAERAKVTAFSLQTVVFFEYLIYTLVGIDAESEISAPL